MTNETASATAPPAVREARPGDVVYSRGPGGHVLLGLVTTAGTLGRVGGQDPAHVIYLTAAWRPMDPRGVNGNVYEWQEKYELTGVNTFGYAQDGMQLWRPAGARGAGDAYTCPNCGSTTGQPVEWDHGTDPETGYHDAGEGCTECTPGGQR